MSQITYKVGDVRRLVTEMASNEFKPVIGKDVESNDKKNARETYKDAEKRAKDFDGGLSTPQKRPLEPRMSGNKTTLDYDYDAPPSEQFDDRVKAQAQGYSNTLEKENGIEKVGDFNDDFYENEKKTAEINDKHRENVRTSGLVSSKLKDKDEDYGKVHTVFNENQAPVKRLTFKHTRFINESQIYQRIPEDYKKDGNTFIVRDANQNEFLIEWCVNEKTNLSEGRIVKQRNLKEADEKIDRMMQLFNYNSGDYNKKNVINENTSVEDMLNAARKIIN
jgi:hypothetical protein